jgi:hypothetical protein
VPWSNTYKLGDSVAAVTSLALDDNPGAATIVYDIEHWSETPASEQQDPAAAIAQAAAVAHSDGKKSGTAPDGRFLGVVGNCTYNVSNGIVPTVNWKNIDMFNIQAQALASDSACGAGNVTQYVSFVKQVVSIVRAQNPNIVVTAQLSLSDSSPATILAAASEIEGIGVNAVYIAYQTGVAGCTVANLTQVLTAFK